MNEQVERIISKAEDKGIIIRASVIQARSGGKSVRHGFAMGVHFTLANLWISIDEDLPEFTKKEGSAQISEPVLIKCTNGAITRARRFVIGGEVPAEGWKCIDAGFGVGGDKVTHWMPIPSVMEGEEK